MTNFVWLAVLAAKVALTMLPQYGKIKLSSYKAEQVLKSGQTIDMRGLSCYVVKLSIQYTRMHP